jgi:hypothetical protein
MTNEERYLQALRRIEMLAGDAFCEDLNCQTIHGIKDPVVAECERKLSAIYRAAHCELPVGCHRVHASWREENDKAHKADHGMGGEA